MSRDTLPLLKRFPQTKTVPGDNIASCDPVCCGSLIRGG